VYACGARRLWREGYVRMVLMSRHGAAGSAWPGPKSPSLNSWLPSLRVVADSSRLVYAAGGKGADGDGAATDGFKGRARIRMAVAPCTVGAEDWPGRGWAMFKQLSRA
jgi:hypothetical protein